MLDVARLRVLRELKHRGTLDRVAAALAYSPSTISRQLAQLEKEVGVALLVPDGRGVRLTPQAEVLVAHVERILVILDEAASAVAGSMDHVVGEVRLAAFQTATPRLVPRAVGLLADRHPDLTVRVTLMEPELSLPALRARDFDLVLTEGYPGRPAATIPDVHREHLLDDPLRLVLPSGDPRGLADLHRAAWVLEPPGTTARAWADAVCRSAGFEPDVRFEATDLRLHLDLVREGRCVALLPDLALHAAPRDFTAGDFTLRDLAGSPVRVISTVSRAGSTDHPALQAVREALAQAAHDERGR